VSEFRQLGAPNGC